MRRYLILTVAIFGILALAGHAQALVITPSSGVLDTSRWEGDESSQALINAIIFPIMAGFGTVEELYKQDVAGAESGDLASSYDTTFIGTGGATIEYVTGDIVGDPAFLLVKDGSATPNWYLFYLTALGWNGTDTLELSGFFPGPGNEGGGAISHVALYGGTGETTIPEPGTMMLLGSGLIGLAGWGRKKFRK